MSEQKENKEKQGFKKNHPCCGNCINFLSETKSCSVGGFVVIKSNRCECHGYKEK